MPRDHGRFPDDDPYPAPYHEQNRLPQAITDDSGPLIVTGTGLSMGEPFIQRRERPLSMNLATIGLVICIIVTGILSATPVGDNANGSFSAFQAISGSILLSKDPPYFWYTVVPGDTPESIAAQFHCQVGGFYELNKLLAGQEIQAGISYKIPEDPNYGANYKPPQFVDTSASGQASGGTIYGSTLWTTYAGDPGPDSEVECAPNGDASGTIVPTAYQLIAPDWGASWSRGWSWFHNGDDLAAPPGNPIRAAQSGQVIWAGWDVGGFAWSIKINHCNHISTLYGHMEKLLVARGDRVQAGQIIGLEGNLGNSVGYHLHFSVLVDNQFVDPLPYYHNSVPNILH